MTALGNLSRPEMEPELDEDRRKFLATCGRFAAVTPPALTILLSTSLNTEAIARTGGSMGGGNGGDPGGGNNGNGNRDHDWSWDHHHHHEHHEHRNWLDRLFD